MQFKWYIEAPWCRALYALTVMESTRFDNSTKDIPLPSETVYKRKLIEKTEHLCKCMRWKAFFFLNPNTEGSRKEKFGFSYPQVHVMLNFEKRLLGMIETIKFCKVKCEFQKKIFAAIQNNIMKSDELLVSADKTSNLYRMDTTSFNDLLQKNITRKVTQVITNTIELEAKAIAKKLHLDDRMNTTAKHEAFITLKDHKPNFANNPICRLINAAKAEIAQIRKQLLDHFKSRCLKLWRTGRQS